MGFADWFIRGEWDSDWWIQQCRDWAPGIAGMVFGAAWWVWMDAYVVEKLHEGSPPFKYNWPGIISTIALIFINLVSKNDLQDISDSGDEGANIRARIWLLFSFLMALGAVVGSVMVLIACTQANQFVSIGVGSVVQSGMILLSALLLWVFRTNEGGGMGYSYI